MIELSTWPVRLPPAQKLHVLLNPHTSISVRTALSTSRLIGELQRSLRLIMYYSENKCWPNTQFELPPQLLTLDDVGGHLLWQDTKEEPFPVQDETEEEKAEIERRFEQLMRDIPKAELHIHIEGS